MVRFKEFAGKERHFMDADSWALGDVALLFAMTRPIDTDTITHFDKSIPWSIWLILFIFTSIGVSLIRLEIRWIRRVLGEG